MVGKRSAGISAYPVRNAYPSCGRGRHLCFHREFGNHFIWTYQFHVCWRLRRRVGFGPAQLQEDYAAPSSGIAAAAAVSFSSSDRGLGDFAGCRRNGDRASYRTPTWNCRVDRNVRFPHHRQQRLFKLEFGDRGRWLNHRNSDLGRPLDGFYVFSSRYPRSALLSNFDCWNSSARIARR